METGFAEQVFAPSEIDQFGNPVARRHERLVPLDAGDSGACLGFLGSFCNFANPRLERFHQSFAFGRDSAGVGDPLNVVPDIGQSVRLEGDQDRAARNRTSQGALDIGEADGAYFALGLGDDVSGLKTIEYVVENFVDRERVGQLILHAAVNFGAGSRDGKSRSCADGQAKDFFGMIAFVGSADLIGSQAERVYDFSWRLQSARRSEACCCYCNNHCQQFVT